MIKNEKNIYKKKMIFGNYYYYYRIKIIKFDEKNDKKKYIGSKKH